jgi:hypothetical protein
MHMHRRRVILWLFLPGTTLDTALDAIDVYSKLETREGRLCLSL